MAVVPREEGLVIPAAFPANYLAGSHIALLSGFQVTEVERPGTLVATHPFLGLALGLPCPFRRVFSNCPRTVGFHLWYFASSSRSASGINLLPAPFAALPCWR